MNRIDNFSKKLLMRTLRQKIAFLRRVTKLNEQSIEELAYRLQIINDYNQEKKLRNEERETKKEIISESEEEMFAKLRATVNLLPRARGK